MSSDLYEVILDGGGPWGIRLQGGKDFGIPLNIARVTPGSKAANKRLIDGDQIMEINYTPTETLTHMEAQNIIKNAGDKLQLKLKPGKGVSLGEIKQVGSGGFAANPSQTLYVTETVHSAGVDHKFNAKPRAFGSSDQPSTASAAVSGKKFDPAEYARKKKEELEKYKEEKNNPKEIDSDVLKMLQNTNVGQGQGSFAKLDYQLQHEDLPPPPPDMFDHEHEAPKSGGTFKSMQHHIEAGTADEIRTVFSQPPGQRGQPVYAGPPKKITSPQGYSNPTPKSSMVSGPNFKVGRASAPTFKANPVQTYSNKPPPPPAVNATEILNPNSRLLANSQYPSPPQAYESNKSSSPTNSYQQPAGGPGRFSPQSYGNPPPQPAGNVNKVMTKGSPQSTTTTPQKGLICHACEQPLIGPFVSAIGRTWHPEHFCCSACNTSLQNQAFVEENNALYCEKCYNQYFAPKCAHCNNAIIGTATNDIICDMCLASADRVFDPLQCSLSINWLMKQLNEVNSSTDAAARQISENNARIKKARLAISKANAYRKSIEDKISLCDKEIVKVSQTLEIKQKILAAGVNLRSANEKFAANMQILQSDIDTAKCKLYSWQSTLAEIMAGYKLKCERLEVAQQRRSNLHKNMNELQTTLNEMNARIKEIKRKQETRAQSGVTMLEEVKLLEFAVEEVETRKVFAEQHLESLKLYEEMMKNEHLQQRVANLNLQDEVEIAQRKKKDLMRQLNISHPMQVLR